MSKGSMQRMMNNESVEIKPSTIALGLGLLGIGLYAMYDKGRTSGEVAAKEQMGAVHRSMGGRGPEAGAGVAGWMGGRGEYQPYEYEAPSSVVTGWSKLP